MSSSAPRIVLAGGGTGGHVIPALAVAEEIEERGGQVRFIGTRERIEARLVPQYGFGIDFISVRPLLGGGVAVLSLGIISAPAAVARAALLLRTLRPDVVLGVGGYVAGPVVLAARLSGISTALLEQNACAGLTNRLLARVVDRAFVSYQETASSFPSGRAQFTGNPVRKGLVQAAVVRRAPNSSSPVRILVMGGSQGALTIDTRVPQAMTNAGLGGRVRVLHQCGPGRQDEVVDAYRAAGIEAQVQPFIDDTATAYLQADFVVARAGATTVAEVTVVGLPAVFLPYPHHTDHQQEKNAEPMRRAGAAMVLDEKKTGVDQLAEAIGSLVKDPAQREAAARASLELGMPQAAQLVVDGLWQLANRRGRG